MTVLDIDATAYHRDDTGRYREIVDRLLAVHGLDPNDVFRVEITEAGAWVWKDTKPRLVGVYWDGCWRDRHGNWYRHPTGCGCDNWGHDCVRVRRWYPHPGLSRPPSAPVEEA